MINADANAMDTYSKEVALDAEKVSEEVALDAEKASEEDTLDAVSKIREETQSFEDGSMNGISK